MDSPYPLADAPVGVFDSGLGGLSVTREIRKRLPHEDIVYFADSAYCPYGIKSPEEIRLRSEVVVGSLIEAGVKTVVIACNTASAMALPYLRKSFPEVPLIGLEPAVKPAVERTRVGKVGVLATPRTVAGERLRWLIETYAGGVAVHRVAATGLVELVEAGVLDGPEVDAALRPLLEPMIEIGVDTAVLGCTHYPFLRVPIERYLGPGVEVIDSGEAIARRLEVVLDERGTQRRREAIGAIQLATSGDPRSVGPVATRLVAEAIEMLEALEQVTANEMRARDLIANPFP